MSEQKNKKRIYERRTSWKVVIANIFIVAACCFILSYVYGLRNSIMNQRLNIDKQNRALALTSELTQSVHQAQSAANLYAFSDNSKYLRQFRTHTQTIKCICDSLIENDPSEENAQRLADIQNLIQRKGQISYVLSRQFYYFDPLAEIDNAISGYTPPPAPEPIYVTTVTKDTIIHKPKERKGFWQRVGNVFNPTDEDSIVQITTQRVDTLPQQKADTTSQALINDIKTLSVKAKANTKPR